MKFFERRPGEGRIEQLARLNTVENLGMCALLAAGAVVAPPAAAAALALAAGAEGAGAIVSKVVHDRLKEKRLRKGRKKS